MHRLFAALYDPFLWLGECLGLRARRAALLRQARGRTLEIGGGTGLNLPHYPDDLDELVVTEARPPRCARACSGRMRRTGRTARLADASADALPFADGSVDTVVSTLVLCTVDDPDRALSEIARVLAPGGQLLLLEHVRATSPTLARWQDRLERPWRRFAQGCRCNRPTADLLAANGFALADVREGRWRAMPPIVAPLIVGRAGRSG